MALNEPLDPLERASRDFLLRRQVSNDESRLVPLGARGAHDDLHVAHAWDLAGMVAEDKDIRALRSAALNGERLPRLRSRWRGWAMATAAAGIAGLIFTGGIGTPRRPAIADHAGNRVIATGDARRLVVLPDGSRVMLDARSSIRTAFSGEARGITLIAGRGYFTVHHEARPFVVRAGQGEIIDLGTRFVVEKVGFRTSVDLIEGKVAIRPAAFAAAVALKPGEKVSFAPGAALSAIGPTTGDPIDWTTGKLTFDDTPLAQAVRAMSRYTPRPIVLGDDLAARDRRVTGVFLIGSSNGFAEALASALDLKIVKQDDGSLRMEPK